MGKKKGNKAAPAASTTDTAAKRDRLPPLQAAVKMMTRWKATAAKLATRVRGSVPRGDDETENVKLLLASLHDLDVDVSASVSKLGELIDGGLELGASRKVSFAVGDHVEIAPDKREAYRQGGLFSTDFLGQVFTVVSVAPGKGRAGNRLAVRVDGGAGGMVVKAAHVRLATDSDVEADDAEAAA